jgi:hypothetical protein
MSAGSLVKISSRVLVMGFPTAQAIRRNVADAAVVKSGVYAIVLPFWWLRVRVMVPEWCGIEQAADELSESRRYKKLKAILCGEHKMASSFFYQSSFHWTISISIFQKPLSGGPCVCWSINSKRLIL